MKTAISMADDLFQKVEQLAAEEHLSRSEVFARAVRAYVDQRHNATLLQELNRAYGEKETSEEKETRRRSKRRYASNVLKARSQ